MDRVFRAVIFDMDGVLVDSEPLHGKAWTDVLRPLGIPLEDGWFIPWVGIPDHTLADDLLAAHALAVTHDELLAQKRMRYASLIETELRPFPGVIEGIARLNGIAKAVVTSSCRRYATRCLAMAGMAEYFQAVVSADDVPRHKPDPLPYVHAAQLLDVPPAQCIAIEDSAAGIASAKAAGCHVVGVTTSYDADALGRADVIHTSMQHAMEYVCGQLAV